MEQSIQEWLKKFREAWMKADIDKVMQLFADDVDYYETPYKKLSDREEVRNEWKSVENQEDISLQTKVFSGENGKYTVKWSLSYTEDGETVDLKGVYLIKLDRNGKCTEFWQYCQNE